MKRLGPLAVVGTLAMANAVWSGTATQKYIASSSVTKRAMYYWVHLPANYASEVQAGKKFAVVYLLHQYSFYAASWHQQSGAQPNPQANWAVDSVAGIICVAPDDGFSAKSWWMDSPAIADEKLSTYLTTELRDSVNKQYATYTDRTHTGICGVSMGGYGALHNLRIHPEVYSAGYSVVGCVDLNKWKTQFDIPTVLPNYSASYDILPNAASYKTLNVKIAFYTGETDFFKDDNVAFDAALTTAGMTHTYQLLSGGHEMPTHARMVMILRWFQQAMYGTTVSEPSTPRTAAQRVAGGKHRTFVQLSRGAIPAADAGADKGIDGKVRPAGVAPAVIVR